MEYRIEVTQMLHQDFACQFWDLKAILASREDFKEEDIPPQDIITAPQMGNK
jgi:hypothetical protein